jgi:hypothetical protein
MQLLLLGLPENLCWGGEEMVGSCQSRGCALWKKDPGRERSGDYYLVFSGNTSGLGPADTRVQCLVSHAWSQDQQWLT